MGKGGREKISSKEEEGEREGVMATDFFWSYTDEPHASRRRQILSRYPQIRQLFGPDPWAFVKITFVVILQLATAAILHNSGWPAQDSNHCLLLWIVPQSQSLLSNP